MVRKAKIETTQEISVFMRYLWFYIFFIFLLVMIASFGLIAEA